MKNVRQYVTAGILLAFLVVILGGIIVFYYFTGKSRSYVTSMSSQQLEDYARHNAYVTKQELENSLNLIQNAADRFKEIEHFDSNQSLEIMRTVASNTPFSNIIVSDCKGNAVDMKGKKLDESSSEDYQREAFGEATIVNHGDLLVIGSPIISQEGKVVGTIQGEYDIFSLSQMIDMESFDGESYSIIVDTNGNYILNSQSSKVLNLEEVNLWEFLKESSFDDGMTLNRFKEKIQLNKSGCVSISKKGTNRVIFYTPVGINDWYLLKMVTSTHIDDATKPVEHMVIVLTLKIVILFTIFVAIALVLIIFLNQEKNKQLKHAFYEAENANKEKSRFLSRISHEIRTPMNSIVDLTEVAETDLTNPEKMQEYLEKIKNSSKLLLGVVNDILDISAIENNKLKLSHTSFDFKQLIESISELYYPICQERNINLQFFVHGVTVNQVMGDSLRVKQILVSILSKAVKNIDENGNIICEITQTSQIGHQVFMHITIEDDGTEEVDENEIESSIVKKLTELMNGTVNEIFSGENGTKRILDLSFDCIEAEEQSISFPDVQAYILAENDAQYKNFEDIFSSMDISSIRMEKDIKWERTLHNRVEHQEGYEICFVDLDLPAVKVHPILDKIRKNFDQGEVIVIGVTFGKEDLQYTDKWKGIDTFLAKPLFEANMRELLMSITDGKMMKSNINPEYDFSGYRVLLAEDIDLNRQVAGSILEKVGFIVDEAQNGKEALDLFENSSEGTYDVILMDVQMPELDGYEATKMIRELKRGDASEVPIFAMAANTSNQDIAQAIANGMNGHVSKPIDAIRLYQTLSECLIYNR